MERIEGGRKGSRAINRETDTKNKRKWRLEEAAAQEEGMQRFRGLVCYNFSSKGAIFRAGLIAGRNGAARS